MAGNLPGRACGSNQRHPPFLRDTPEVVAPRDVYSRPEPEHEPALNDSSAMAKPTALASP